MIEIQEKFICDKCGMNTLGQEYIHHIRCLAPQVALPDSWSLNTVHGRVELLCYVCTKKVSVFLKEGLPE